MGIEVENVSFSYTDRKVLKDVNFKIENGEFVGLVGSTGCGNYISLLLEWFDTEFY